MRRTAGIGLMLLGLAGCQSLPSTIRIEIDGSTLEFRKKEPTAPERPLPEEGSENAPAR